MAHKKKILRIFPKNNKEMKGCADATVVREDLTRIKTAILKLSYLHSQLRKGPVGDMVSKTKEGISISEILRERCPILQTPIADLPPVKSIMKDSEETIEDLLKVYVINELLLEKVELARIVEVWLDFLDMIQNQAYEKKYSDIRSKGLEVIENMTHILSPLRSFAEIQLE